MSSWPFYTSVLFAAIIFVLGCAIWLITGSKLDATIVMVAVGARVVTVMSPKTPDFSPPSKLSRVRGRVFS